MRSITSLDASAIPRQQLGDILADYLALEHVRQLRRLLIKRCGLTALLIVAVGTISQLLTPFARWLVAALFSIGPTWAWWTEVRIKRQLTKRLEQTRP